MTSMPKCKTIISKRMWWCMGVNLYIQSFGISNTIIIFYSFEPKLDLLFSQNILCFLSIIITGDLNNHNLYRVSICCELPWWHHLYIIGNDAEHTVSTSTSLPGIPSKVSIKLVALIIIYIIRTETCWDSAVCKANKDSILTPILFYT